VFHCCVTIIILWKKVLLWIFFASKKWIFWRFSRVQKKRIFPKNFWTSITELFQNSRKQKVGKFRLSQGLSFFPLCRLFHPNSVELNTNKNMFFFLTDTSRDLVLLMKRTSLRFPCYRLLQVFVTYFRKLILSYKLFSTFHIKKWQDTDHQNFQAFEIQK